MNVSVTTKDVKDSSGRVITRGECLDLWSCERRGISSIRQSTVVRGSRNRTVENVLRQDITGTYRIWTIGYELLDYRRYKQIKEIFDSQCLGLACLSLKITNTCSNPGCDCAEVDSVTTNVFMELSDFDYSQGDNGRFITGFSLTFEESNPNCEDCNEC